MPNVSLTLELERFAEQCVSSGRFNNVSEVVRSALRMLQDAETQRAALAASLEAAMAQGERDGFTTAGDMAAQARAVIAAAHQRQR